MGSLYLNRLTHDENEELKNKLLEIQNSKCFICEEPIDLKIHSVQIDHVIPIKLNGQDDPLNFALTHSSCNESKQDADLRVARILSKFNKIRNNCLRENRGANLSDILNEYGGSKYEISLEYRENENLIKYSFTQLNDNKLREEKLYLDKLSGFKYFFAILPIEYIFHDDKINPRSIGQNISKLIKEFFLKRPQLHISLGWINTENNQEPKIKIFDGQHKAAAQVMLGARELPVRIFLNPDIEILLTTNTNAGTTLRQVAFDKSIQRHLGNALYIDRVQRYQREHDLSSDDLNFSERDLVNYYKGESKEMKRYILDSVRDAITHNPANKLKDFIDFGGRGKEKPLSYSTIEKTFYSFFIYQETLDAPITYLLEEGENPREIEKEQIFSLMNIIADELFLGKFDLDFGTYKIENRIQKGEDIPESHLIAYRMSKEEILYNWLRYIAQIIKNYFIMQGKPIQENKLFQYRFPESLWARIKTFILNLSNLPLWVNKELSSTIFGGKQNYEYWQTIFETGKTSQGFQVLAKPINLMEMIVSNKIM
jgi:hypothetical protein